MNLKNLSLIIFLVNLVALPFFLGKYLDLLVSLKYETDGNDCISGISGKNLCTILLLQKIAMGLSLLLILLGAMGALAFKHKEK